MRLALVAALLSTLACRGSQKAAADAPKAPVTVFAAASLARPLKMLADSFTATQHAEVRSELGGSLDQSRKLTDLGRIPDVLILVDDEVMAALMPAHIDWYVRFATNRLAVVYSAKSRHRDSITTENWWQVLQRRDVRIGRADPNVAPVGRHAVALLQRAQTYYQKPGLTAKLMARATQEFVRPNATELAALLETGDVDYIIDYESVAQQYGFNFVSLPRDLAADVLYGISVPRSASNFQGGVNFTAFLLSERGRRMLRSSNLNVMAVPVAVGSAVPPEISGSVRTIASLSTP